jgi:hypothetical protein
LDRETRNWCRGTLSKRIVAEIKGAGRSPGPRKVRAQNPGGEKVRFENPSVEYAIVCVDIGNELILDTMPTPSWSSERRAMGPPFRSMRAAAVMYRSR